jgi:hypothetical protein
MVTKTTLNDLKRSKNFHGVDLVIVELTKNLNKCRLIFYEIGKILTTTAVHSPLWGEVINTLRFM